MNLQAAKSLTRLLNSQGIIANINPPSILPGQAPIVISEQISIDAYQLCNNLPITYALCITQQMGSSFFHSIVYKTNSQLEILNYLNNLLTQKTITNG